ncbi:MAG: MarR family winged helix-turn-helix transcriptional regulator [Holophaga sp.]|jgi:DNA-binding MarR family transcriptional regulator
MRNKADEVPSANPKQQAAQEIVSTISRLYFLLKPTYSEDLTHQSVRVLQFIAMHPGNPRIDEVRQHLGIAPASTSELVKRLSAKDLVVRKRSLSDERIVELELTEKGRSILAQQTQMDVSKLAMCLKGSKDWENQALIEGLNNLAARAEGLIPKGNSK